MHDGRAGFPGRLQRGMTHLAVDLGLTRLCLGDHLTPHQRGSKHDVLMGQSIRTPFLAKLEDFWNGEKHAVGSGGRHGVRNPRDRLMSTPLGGPPDDARHVTTRAEIPHGG